MTYVCWSTDLGDADHPDTVEASDPEDAAETYYRNVDDRFDDDDGIVVHVKEPDGTTRRFLVEREVSVDYFVHEVTDEEEDDDAT